MKHNFYRKRQIMLVLTCLLFLQAGCRQQLEPRQEPQAAFTQPGPPPALTAPALSQAYTPVLARAYTASSARRQPTGAHTSQQREQRAPQITFDKVAHNYGNIGPMTKNIYRFDFTNTGNATLEISKVKACCRVVARLVGDRKQYSPGQSGAVEVELTAGAHPGSVLKHIYVESNDRSKPKVPLTLKAKVVAKVSCEPKELTLRPGKQDYACPPIKLKSLDGQPFAIKAFTSTAGCLSADCNPALRKTLFVLTPQLDLQKLRHAPRGNIQIHLTHPQCQLVVVSYKALQRFKLNPRSIGLFRVEPQKPIRRTVHVLNNYNEDFQIQSATSTSGIIEILSTKKIGNGYQFMLQITPPAVSDESKFFTDAFSVTTTDGETLTIPLRGFYAPKALESSGP